MDKLIIKGKIPLKGEIRVGGAKNSILPLLFSSLLAEGEHVFHNVSDLTDVHFACRLLETFGCSTHFSDSILRIKVKPLKKLSALYDVVRKMRASILCLAPLLVRHGHTQVSLPGGCAIGLRPVDLHIEALRALGAEIKLRGGYIVAKCKGKKRLRGKPFLFKKISVGATENLLMAATLAEGTTLIENAASEPEIVDLANYLNKMGAMIRGAGTKKITITGVDKLRASEHKVIPDRVEAGTLLMSGAITKGEVTVTSCEPKHLEEVLKKLRSMGFKMDVEKSSITIHSAKEWKGVNIETSPFPGFPTDLQAQFMALSTVCCGESWVSETVFENRFMHVQELLRMNAKITLNSHHLAVVKGEPDCLKAAPVMTTDLRASAGLVIAGLSADGETEIHRVYHLDRGYERLEEKLSLLGAKIQRKKA